MTSKIDLVGKKFGILSVIKQSESINGRGTWECLCECGSTTIVTTQRLRRRTKPTRSCGCLRGESHGMWKSPEYRAWINMKNRCYSPKNSKYNIYGGRGIKVSPTWRNSFIKFYEDMSQRPSPKHSLDRINGNGNYEADNCRWATISEQNNNTSANRVVTINGISKNITQWANYLGVKRQKIYDKMRSGRDSIQAVKECM